MKKSLLALGILILFSSRMTAQEEIEAAESVEMPNKNSLENFKKNNFSILPLMVNVGLGPGIQYERYIDENNNFSFVLPVQVSFLNMDAKRMYNNNNGFNNVYINDYFINSINIDNQIGFSVNPGLRLYFVEPRKFNWFIGMSFMYNYLNVNGNYQIVKNSTGDIYNYKKMTNNSFSTLVNVGFKGTINNSVTYQVEFGNGVRYLNDSKYKEGLNNESDFNGNYGVTYMGNFAVGFGFIF